MRDTVTIALGDGRVYRAVMTDLKVTRDTETMQTAAGHAFRVATSGPRGSLKFVNLEEIEAPSPSLSTKAPSASPETEDPNWGMWS